MKKLKDGKVLLEIFIDLERYHTPQLINYIFDITEQIFKKEGRDIIDYLRKKFALTKLIFKTVHISTQTFSKFSRKIEKDEFRNILLKNQGGNIIDLWGRNHGGDEDRFIVWNMIVATIADPQEIKRLLRDSSPIHGTYDYFPIAGSGSKFSSPLILKMLKWCSENFNHEDLKQMFSELDRDKSSVVHYLAETGDKDTVRNFLKIIQQKELQEMFLLKDRRSFIPLQSAFKNAEPEVVEIFWKAYCDAFDTESLLNIISIENFVYKGYFVGFYELDKQRHYESTQKLFRDWKAEKTCQKYAISEASTSY